MAARDLGRVLWQRSNEQYRPSSCCALCRALPNRQKSERPSHSVDTRQQEEMRRSYASIARARDYLEACTAELLIAVFGDNVLLDVIVVDATDPALSLISRVSLTMKEMRLVAE